MRGTVHPTTVYDAKIVDNPYFLQRKKVSASKSVEKLFALNYFI